MVTHRDIISETQKQTIRVSEMHMVRSLLLMLAYQPGAANMSILAWSILGVISGLIAGKFVSATADGIMLDIIWGVVGALIGGAIANLGAPGTEGITSFSVAGLFLALIGAILVLTIRHALLRRRHAQK